MISKDMFKTLDQARDFIKAVNNLDDVDFHITQYKRDDMPCYTVHMYIENNYLDVRISICTNRDKETMREFKTLSSAMSVLIAIAGQSEVHLYFHG